MAEKEKAPKGEKVYVRIALFDLCGKEWKAEFDPKVRRNFFIIDKDMPEKVVDFIYKRKVIV